MLIFRTVLAVLIYDSPLCPVSNEEVSSTYGLANFREHGNAGSFLGTNFLWTGLKYVTLWCFCSFEKSTACWYR